MKKMGKTMHFMTQLILCFSFFVNALEEKPAKKQKTSHESVQQPDRLTFEASDGTLNTAPITIAELSPFLSDHVDEKQTTISFAQFGINATTLQYYLDCLKNIMNGIEAQKKLKDFPTPFLLQRKDGQLIAKNVLPTVKNATSNISSEDFVNLVKLSQFTETEFLLNALCSLYITRNYASKNFSDFLKDKQSLIQQFGQVPYSLLKKHAYIQKVLPWPSDVEPYEMSVGDYVTLYPEKKIIHRNGTRLIIFDKVNNTNNNTQTYKHITSLDGLDLINLESLKMIKIESDFLIPYQYDPFFPESPFFGAQEVRSLEIANTILYTLPEEFLGGLPDLEELSLKNIMLSYLSDDFFEPVATTIQEISLQHNKITELDTNIFNKPSQFLLYKVFLSKNPICEKLDDSYFNLRPNDEEKDHRYIDCTTE